MLEIAPVSTFCYSRDFRERDKWLGGHAIVTTSVSYSAHLDDYDIDGRGAFKKTHGTDDFSHDWRHGRIGSKSITLRSWRNPRFVSGVCASRKLDRRRPKKPLFYVAIPGHTPYLMG